MEKEASVHNDDAAEKKAERLLVILTLFRCACVREKRVVRLTLLRYVKLPTSAWDTKVLHSIADRMLLIYHNATFINAFQINVSIDRRLFCQFNDDGH